MATWLSPTFGRLATAVKGAQRARSLFLGQMDLFYTCELLFYSREHHGVHIARECTPLHPRSPLRDNWRSCAAASFAADTALRISHPGEQVQPLFALISRMLDYWCDCTATIPDVLWMELHLLSCLGLAPALQHCPRCRRAYASAPSACVYFSPQDGGLVCPDCRTRRADALEPLAPAARLALESLRQANDPSSIPADLRKTADWRQPAQLLESFLNYHLDISARSRILALQILSRKTWIDSVCAESRSAESPMKGA